MTPNDFKYGASWDEALDWTSVDYVVFSGKS